MGLPKGRESYGDGVLIVVVGLLDTGYLENWKYNTTHSGVPQGSVVSPILSNLVLDKLDKYVEHKLIPAHTRGLRRRVNPPYSVLTHAAAKARKAGKLEEARKLSQQAQTIPSRDPNDPNFRRLCYVRYADDFLLGVVGSKSVRPWRGEAVALEIKQKIATFLRDELKLELSDEKTLVTHSRDEVAKFLGYEIHVLHADDKHDHRGQRCINGSLGLRVPKSVIEDHCAKYMHSGKPIHLTQRVNDDAYSSR